MPNKAAWHESLHHLCSRVAVFHVTQTVFAASFGCIICSREDCMEISAVPGIPRLAALTDTAIEWAAVETDKSQTRPDADCSGSREQPLIQWCPAEVL